MARADEEKPKSKTKIERLAEEWREFGIELKIGDHTPNSHILTFFGAVPEESGDEERNEDEEPT
jgi:hypothetical protein